LLQSVRLGVRVLGRVPPQRDILEGAANGGLAPLKASAYLTTWSADRSNLAGAAIVPEIRVLARGAIVQSGNRVGLFGLLDDFRLTALKSMISCKETDARIVGAAFAPPARGDCAQSKARLCEESLSDQTDRLTA